MNMLASTPSRSCLGATTSKTIYTDNTSEFVITIPDEKSDPVSTLPKNKKLHNTLENKNPDWLSRLIWILRRSRTSCIRSHIQNQRKLNKSFDFDGCPTMFEPLETNAHKSESLITQPQKPKKKWRRREVYLKLDTKHMWQFRDLQWFGRRRWSHLTGCARITFLF